MLTYRTGDGLLWIRRWAREEAATVRAPQRSPFHLAQVNVMHAKSALDSAAMRSFVAELEPTNALAERSAGFVWRLQTEDGDATAIRPFDDDLTLINMSVWETQESLWNYAYASQHLNVMRRRREWVARVADVVLALWWIDAGHIPTVDEAKHRLDLLRHHGPTPAAFTFRQSFPPPEVAPLAPDRERSACNRDSEATRGTAAGRGTA
jgi:hypothetical protein